MRGNGRKNLMRMRKNILVTICMLLLVGGANAQYNSKGELISRFHPGSMWYFTGFRPAETEKVRKYDRLIFDLTYNDWSGDLGPLKNNWNSLGFNTNLMFDIPLAKENVVSLGIGLSHSIYRVSNNSLQFAADSTHSYTLLSTLTESQSNGIKRSLGANSFALPLELRFRTKGWKHFKVHLGGKVGYQYDLFAKSKMDGSNGRVILKDHDLPDVNRLIYSAHIRFGLRNWALYASYNLNSIFKNDQSPQLNMIQAGLSISLY